jgi:hypothetical protein
MPAQNCPTCHHLFPDSHRCGSPALRGQNFCYFHHPDLQLVAQRKAAPPRPPKINSPRKYPECRHIQCPFRNRRLVR